MDLNKFNNTNAPETTAARQSAIKELKHMIEIGLCYWHGFINCDDRISTPEELLAASKQLQKEGKLRLKEDSYEHCMEYILVRTPKND